MIITGSDASIIAFLNSYLHSQFEMKDLGVLLYFLGIEVAYFSRGYLLSQQKYIANIFQHATLYDSYIFEFPSVSTHMELNLKLQRDDGDPLPESPRYRKLMVHLSIFLLLV